MGNAMKEIPLTQGKVALVDDEDFEELNKYKWRARKGKNTFYAKRSTKRPNQKTIEMHRQILGFPAGFQTDHRDGNGLNNQRSNLRICTISQNQHNTGKQKRNTSGYKGVCFHKNAKRFIALIMVNRKSTHLGYFNTAIEAALAYDAAAIKLHGEFAQLNFKKDLNNLFFIK
jgi:hypothetical protein